MFSLSRMFFGAFSSRREGLFPFCQPCPKRTGLKQPLCSAIENLSNLCKHPCVKCIKSESSERGAFPLTPYKVCRQSCEKVMALQSGLGDCHSLLSIFNQSPDQISSAMGRGLWVPPTPLCSNLTNILQK